MLIPTFQVAWLFTLSKSSGSTFLSRNVSQAMAWVQAADQTAGYVSWTILESQDWNRNVFDERGKERERWRINVKRSSPLFPASKIVTKVNKVPICTFAQIGSQFDLCPSRGETAPKQCSWSSSSFHWSRKCFWPALSSLEIHIFMDFLLLSILWVKKFPWQVFLAFLCWVSGA